MMVRFFRGSGAGPATVLVMFAAALWAGYFITPPRVLPSLGGAPMPLWKLVTDSLSGMPLLAVIISFALMIIVSVVMERFNTSVFFIPRRTVFPGLFFILFYSAFPGEMVLNPVLPATLLVVTGLWRMVSAYRLNGMVFNFFDSALLISVAAMFYAGSLWFLPLAVIGAMVFRKPDIREISLSIMGALLPWIILYAVWYVTGGNISDLSEIIRHNLFDKMPSVYWSRTLVILLCIIALNFLPGLFYLFREMPTLKIKSRKTFELLLWMLVICAAVYLFVPAVSFELNVLTAIPASFIMANYCVFTRRVAITEILFWLMVVMIVIIRVWPY
jgi:hypothetical protein